MIGGVAGGNNRLKVPISSHPGGVPFTLQESTRCSSTAGIYTNTSSPNNPFSIHSTHPRHASSSSAYNVPGQLLGVPPVDGGGGSNSYLSDSDIHMASVTSSPGQLRTKSISPTVSSSTSDVMFAHSNRPPRHHDNILSHDQLFCPTNFFHRNSTDSHRHPETGTQPPEGPLQLRKSPTTSNYRSVDLWDSSAGGGLTSASTGGVLTLGMDDFSATQRQQQQQQHTTPTSPMSFVMRDTMGSGAGSGGDDRGTGGGSNENSSTGNTGGDSYQLRQGSCVFVLRVRPPRRVQCPWFHSKLGP